MAALDRTIGEIRAFITDPEASAQPGELAQRLAELVEEYRGGSVPRAHHPGPAAPTARR